MKRPSAEWTVRASIQPIRRRHRPQMPNGMSFHPHQESRGVLRDLHRRELLTRMAKVAGATWLGGLGLLLPGCGGGSSLPPPPPETATPARMINFSRKLRKLASF